MTAQKLTCPECSTVLRPAKPVAPGKKVKCPRCETVFAAPRDDDDEDAHEAPTMKPAAKAKSPSSRAGGSAKTSSRSGGKTSAKPSRKDEDSKKEEKKEEVYGVVKDDADEVAEKEGKPRKPKIEYAPDTSIKDLRGPAVAMLVTPSNMLAVVGFLGFFGWLTLIVFLIIPAAFPIKPDKADEVMHIEEGLGSVDQDRVWGGMAGFVPAVSESQKKFEEEQAGFFEVFGIDLWNVGALAWYIFWPALIPFVILMFASGLVGYGSIQAVNLESRRWGIAGCILAMMPFTVAGLAMVTIMVSQFFLGMIIDDKDFLMIVSIVLASAEYVASLAVGIWMLVMLMKEEVIAGFEYVAE
jgi:hypothetical protein